MELKTPSVRPIVKTNKRIHWHLGEDLAVSVTPDAVPLEKLHQLSDILDELEEDPVWKKLQQKEQRKQLKKKKGARNLQAAIGFYVPLCCKELHGHWIHREGKFPEQKKGLLLRLISACQEIAQYPSRILATEFPTEHQQLMQMPEKCRLFGVYACAFINFSTSERVHKDKNDLALTSVIPLPGYNRSNWNRGDLTILSTEPTIKLNATPGSCVIFRGNELWHANQQTSLGRRRSIVFCTHYKDLEAANSETKISHEHPEILQALKDPKSLKPRMVSSSFVSQLKVNTLPTLSTVAVKISVRQDPKGTPPLSVIPLRQAHVRALGRIVKNLRSQFTKI